MLTGGGTLASKAPVILRSDQTNPEEPRSIGDTMGDKPNYDRRTFLRNSGLTIAAAQLASTGIAKAQASTNTSFASIRQVNAGLLNVGYAEAGPADGPTVVLLHGWPYDIHSYVEVAPLLAAHGYRVIVPY